MPQQVSRRAVARGAAWAVPVVTVSVAAPASAATSFVNPTASVPAGQSTKCPGQNPNFFYKLVLSFDNPGSAPVIVEFPSVRVGAPPAVPSQLVAPTSTLAAHATTRVEITFNSTNSMGNLNVEVLYQFRGSPTGPVLGTGSLSQSVKFDKGSC